jgi:nitrate reductase beta subunit
VFDDVIAVSALDFVPLGSFAVVYAVINRAIRSRLYALPVSWAARSVLAIPLKRVRRRFPVVFIQPKISSIRFLIL